MSRARGGRVKRSALAHTLPPALVLVAVLGAALSASLEAQAEPPRDDWRRFESEVGRFAIDMPAEPAERQKKRWLPIGSVVSRVYTARVGDDAFGLNHTDVPSIAMKFTPRESVFQSAREGFLEDSHAHETAFEATLFAGRDAKLLRYAIAAQPERAPLVGTARLFFEERRLYIVWTEVTAGRAGADLERYFTSFALRVED